MKICLRAHNLNTHVHSKQCILLLIACEGTFSLYMGHKWPCKLLPPESDCSNKIVQAMLSKLLVVMHICSWHRDIACNISALWLYYLHIMTTCVSVSELLFPNNINPNEIRHSVRKEETVDQIMCGMARTWAHLSLASNTLREKQMFVWSERSDHTSRDPSHIT